jgi:hypothetical protein
VNQTLLEGGKLVDGERIRDIISGIITDRHTRKFIVGALLAASFYFVTAGVNEILLAGYERCVAQNERLFLSPMIEEVCRPEWQVLLIRASSRHLLGLLFSGIPAILAWFGTSILYAILGGFLGQATPKWGIITFLIVHLATISIIAMMTYMSQFIA